MSETPWRDPLDPDEAAEMDSREAQEAQHEREFHANWDIFDAWLNR